MRTCCHNFLIIQTYPHHYSSILYLTANFTSIVGRNHTRTKRKTTTISHLCSHHFSRKNWCHPQFQLSLSRSKDFFSCFGILRILTSGFAQFGCLPKIRTTYLHIEPICILLFSSCLLGYHNISFNGLKASADGARWKLQFNVNLIQIRNDFGQLNSATKHLNMISTRIDIFGKMRNLACLVSDIFSSVDISDL